MRLMWLPMVESVVKYLSSLKELKNYQVGAIGGVQAPTGVSGQAGVQGQSIIEVDWDSEADAEERSTSATDIAIYLKIKYKTDGTDIMISYREMYRVQNIILDNIRMLQKFLLMNYKVAVDITGAGVAPFGATTRPYYGNQMVLLFRWREE